MVPSLSVALPDEFPESLLHSYEERFLFMLFLLRQPNARMVFVTSEPIDPSIVDYYFGLLANIDGADARSRLTLESCEERSMVPLTGKILKRQELISRIRDHIPDRNRAHIVPFNTTDLERELSLQLGVPMYATDPALLHLGSKSGGRRLFAEEKVPFPAGLRVSNRSDLPAGLASLRKIAPNARAIIKLDLGVGGMSIATLDLSGLPPSGDSQEAAAIGERLSKLEFEMEGATAESFLGGLDEQGAVVEQLLEGEELRSPSVQMRITPLGELEVLSTHDQILGGPGGLTFFGSRFPADPAYAVKITEEAMKVGHRLTSEGVIGRFAVDFVVIRSGAEWDPYAIEINLRKGGTTHPFLALQFLTDGKYRPEEGSFVAPSGQSKCFVTTDHLESEAYVGLSPKHVFEIASRPEIGFDHSAQTGALFHMMSALEEFGRLGITAVGDSSDNAQAIYDRAMGALDGAKH